MHSAKATQKRSCSLITPPRQVAEELSERIDVFPQVRTVLQSSDGQALASETTTTVTGSTGAESTGAVVPAVTNARTVVTAAIPDTDASSRSGC